MTDVENKLRTKEEELKNNEIELVARSEKYEKVQDELGLLKGELTRLYAENRSLQTQLNEAKEEAGTATAKVVSEYQSSAEMATLRQTIWDEAFEEAAKSLAYTTAVQHPNWDLSYLGDHLAAQLEEWGTEPQADQLLVEERPTGPASSVGEIQEVPSPLLDGLPKQVIEGG